MAKRPELVEDGEGDWKVAGSYINGRYQFTLSSGGERLLRSDLDFAEGDTIPIELFRTLVYAGDAWLPGSPQDTVENGKDLVVPSNSKKMALHEVKALANHLEGQRYSRTEQDALEEQLEETRLGQFLSLDDLESNEEWVRDVGALLEDRSPESPTDPQSPDSVGGHEAGSEKSDDDSATRILQIGNIALGRKNMGRKQRRKDYEDAFGQAVDIARQERVDAVIHTGTLFQSRYPSRSTVQLCREELQKLQEDNVSFLMIFSQKDRESVEVDKIQEEGLINHIGGSVVSIDDRVVLYGLDNGDHRDPEFTLHDEELDDGRSLTGVSVNLDSYSRSGPEVLTSISREAPVSPDVFFLGGATDPIRDEVDDVPAYDAGAIENTLGKGTFEETPLKRGVNLYEIKEESLDPTRRPLDERTYETVDLELDRDDDLETVCNHLAGLDLAQKAVLVKVEGTFVEGDSLSKSSIQEHVSDRAFCVRVYDERDRKREDEHHQQTESASETEDVAASSANTSPSGSGNSAPSYDSSHPNDVLEASRSYAATLRELNPSELEEFSVSELADSYALFSEIENQITTLQASLQDELGQRANSSKETPEGERIDDSEGKGSPSSDGESKNTDTIRNGSPAADEVECPVTDCNYRDSLSSVAGHVNGTRDDDHDWSRLPYENTDDFKSRHQ